MDERPRLVRSDTEAERRARQRIRRRRIWRGLVVLVAASLLAVLVRGLLPRPVPAVLGSVDRGPLVLSLVEEGRTRVRERYLVVAPAHGALERLRIEPGDRVTAGQILGRLGPALSPLVDARSRDEATHQLETSLALASRARAERRRAEVALDLARKSLERTRTLTSERAVAPFELDEAEARFRDADESLDAATMSVRASEAEVERARARLETSPPRARGGVDVVAPISGLVLGVLERGPSIVASGTPLVALGDPSELEVVVGLLTRDAVRVASHREATVDADGRSQTPARLRRVEPNGYTRMSALGVEEQRVDVVLDWTPPSALSGLLGDGFRVDVTLTLHANQDALRAPASAVFRRGEGWVAYAVRDGRARLREVVLGARNDRHVEVLGGLEPGDEVVLHPSDRVVDGVRLQRITVER
jgi:HlyD family secretion protein